VRVLVTAPGLEERAAEAAADSKTEQIVVLGGDGPGSLPALVAAGRAVTAAGGRPAVPAAGVAVMLYSSGATGGSKGVMLTHRNLVAAVTASRKKILVAHLEVLQ
jgi:acyl-CoA synthetase (AMP-forming)/AMP-acid ligase II